MAIEITHVGFGQVGRTESAIIRYRWKSLEDNATGDNDKPSMVKWVDERGVAYVGSGANRVSVGTVHPSGAEAYLRTYADGAWTNNLLSLPTF
ncbi:DUF3892 domain-containing protein [Demequina aestuarii]|uniref:DUF3892 domain-containing protein n=1 Tax=Demequina aestuarii TaxID=327095 RepID=UPI0007807F29|nr:DUF3892 domain-containing protein [Demequina aestuarii]